MDAHGLVRAARAWPAKHLGCARAAHAARGPLYNWKFTYLLAHRRGIGRHKASLLFMIYVDVV